MTARTAPWAARAAGLAALATLGACALSAASPAPRQEVADDPVAAIDQAVTAAKLADWGRRSQDPQALIVAARMIDEITFQTSAWSVGTEGGEDSQRSDSPIDPLSSSALLREAQGMARGDADLLAEVEAAVAAAPRGVIDSPFGKGPVTVVKDVRARETYWFQVNARRGEVLRVAAIGDGDANIDMSIQAEDGTMLCDDVDGDHYPVCTITPARPGMLKVNIVNRGVVWTKVRILSN